MTVIEARNRLLKFFETTDVFSFEEHFRQVFPECQEKTIQAQVVRHALMSLVHNRVVTETENSGCWVLVRPLGSYSQNVKLSRRTAAVVARLSNLVGEQMGDRDGLADPLGISEADIQRLCLVCEQALRPEPELPKPQEQIGFAA